ncbi:germination protein YpeB [Thermobrachium celere]|uniref:germination protein YpeB n=1 Tax=Thermobrachium celere TaxID=53422 RepID=UPI001941ABCC|nr:germination protein YpeB [Thermobrachium celere]GFR35387.1 germination protein YpeB [Thermobrachium celere]
MFNKRSFLAIVVSIIIVFTTTFGMLMYLDRRDYRIFLGNQYQKDLYEIVSNVEALQASLSKVPVTMSEKQGIILFSEIWRQAGAAQDKLNSLPISHEALSQTSKFLSQVGDFSYTLLKRSSSGQSLNEVELKTLEKLNDYAGFLNVKLHELQQEVSQGKIDWTEIKLKGKVLFSQQLQNPVDVKFEQISKELQQYPTLIYDGPFSENVLNIKPKVLSEPKISIDEAKRIVKDILGNDKVQSIDTYSNKQGGKIPVYPFKVKMKGNNEATVDVDISQNGGKVVYLLDTREVKGSKISMKQAVEKGMKFLESIGYRDMIPSYTLKYDNIALINYVYVQDKVVVYPDQIKLKIALDNGDIIGVEAQHYLVAHTERKIPKPRITPQEARNNVSRNLNIKNVRLTLIPMESLREVLCYEFYGEYKGEKFIVYINAMDGVEERILKIMDTPNGELTM